MLLRKTKREWLLEIAGQYRSAGEPWPARAWDIAAWAVRNRKWEPKRGGVIRQCAEEIAEALREEIFTDPQGRRVRKNHAIREFRDGKQLTFWIDILDATPAQMRAAFQYRRGQILGDCKQLKTDVDSYNENNADGACIQMVFDFARDLEESSIDVDYPELL